MGAAEFDGDLPRHCRHRAASVVTTFLAGAQPEVWVADRYGGQLGHGAVRQMYLAHLLRDAKYAIDDGDTVFAPGFRLLLLRAVAIGKRRDTLKDSTLAQYLADLDRRLCGFCRGQRRRTNRVAACSAPCGAIATICSASSPAATCHTRITPASGRCGRR
jgi:hypothetical protein